MRLIDADELIKEVNGNPFTTDSVKSYVKISVQKMPTAQPEPHWIPCSERLPEEDQYNLVTMQHANGDIGVVIARLTKSYFGKDLEWESNDCEYTWYLGTAFAWTPLPDPYKG